MANIDKTAIVDTTAELADSVVVGPGAVIGPKAIVGAGTVIDAYAQVGPNTKLGENNHLYQGAIIGSDPQDKKFTGELSTLEVGDDNIFREYVTVNRGTASGGGITRIGNNNLFMVYSHVAHDCVVGNQVVMANSATLAGHITIDDYAIIGGLTPVHQFVRIGKFAFIGGGGWINMDVPPYLLLGGSPSKVIGINAVGLERHGFSSELRNQLKSAFRILYRSQLNVSQALARIVDEIPSSPELDIFVDFLRQTKRGIIR